MKKWVLIVSLAVLVLPATTWAQAETDDPAESSQLERIQKAAELIKTSEEAREAGIPAKDVAEVLEDARERGMPPEETEEILAESTAAIEESGPVDNFGAFVQTKLDEGLRGQELAAAIHEEHKKHGKGKGHDKDKMKKKKHKAHKPDHEGRQSDGDGDHDDHDDHDEDDEDDDKDEDHPKGGKKGKGNK